MEVARGEPGGTFAFALGGTALLLLLHHKRSGLPPRRLGTSEARFPRACDVRPVALGQRSGRRKSVNQREEPDACATRTAVIFGVPCGSRRAEGTAPGASASRADDRVAHYSQRRPGATKRPNFAGSAPPRWSFRRGGCACYKPARCAKRRIHGQRRCRDERTSRWPRRRERRRRQSIGESGAIRAFALRTSFSPT